MTDQQNRRRPDLEVAQFCDQLQPAHSRHPLVDHETVATREVVIEKIRRALVGAYDKPLQFKGELQRIADSRIVINDHDSVNLARRESRRRRC